MVAGEIETDAVFDSEGLPDLLGGIDRLPAGLITKPFEVLVP
jgi:hypothetical protein